MVIDATLVDGLAATQAQEDPLTALIRDRWGSITLDDDDEALRHELLAQVNDQSARGARRLGDGLPGNFASPQDCRRTAAWTCRATRLGG